MRRKTFISRLSSLVLVTLACLVLVLLAPLFFTHRSTDEPFRSSFVMASPRDLFVVTVPVRLSHAPDLTLSRGLLYVDGDIMGGTPINKVVLEGPVFTFNASGLRATVPSFEHSAPGADPAMLSPIVEALALLNFDTLSIRRGMLYLTSAAGTSETISDIEAELTGQRKGQIASRGNFLVRGQRVAFDATFTPQADKRTPLRWPVKLSLKGGLLEAGFEGHADVAEDVKLVGQVEASTPSLRRVARWFGVPVPIADGLNKASLKGQFNWNGRTMAFDDAKVAFDGNAATGALALHYGKERPLVQANLAFNALDLTPYAEAVRSQYFVFDRQTASWSPFDLSFPFIKYVDADLRISAPKVVVHGYGLGHGAATVTAQSGKLVANILELELHGGMASAQVTVDMLGLTPRFVLRGKIEGFEAAQGATALFGTPVLSGRATLTAELTSTGQTPAEIVGGLDGKIAVSMPEAGRLSFDPKAMRGAAKANAAAGWGLLGKGQISVDQLEARGVIVDGVLTTDVVHVRSGSLGVAATGRVNLPDESVDLRLSVKPNVPTDRPLTAADMAGADTVSVRGPWRAPLVRGDDAVAPAN